MEEEKKKKFNPLPLIIGGVVIVILVIILVVAIVLGAFFGLRLSKSKHTGTKTNIVEGNKYAEYSLTGNKIEAFDIYFLQLENNKKNTVYSPLSIKYALEMLNEGTAADSKKQITNILGTYQNKEYKNSSNMSFANAMFIKDTYKNSIKEAYTKTLSTKYNANVVYDSFKSPNALNSWVSDKTFKLIDHLYDDISDKDFILLNALAIDMEWKNKIQSEKEDYEVIYEHEKFSKGIGALNCADYTGLDFSGVSYQVKSAEIGAVANKYDIVKTLGKDTIKKTVKEEYQKWVKEMQDNEYEDVISYCPKYNDDADLEKYVTEINKNYKQISSSTDFSYLVDDNIKVFAKDLKTYNGTTLQYVGIMPTKTSLDSYIKTIKADDLNNIVSSLKDVKIENFKEGTITEIKGFIPMFNYDYQLELIKDLKTLGITDIFDSGKANLSKMTKEKAYISDAIHKATIEFSNDGIKAAAVTALGGKGAIDECFNYQFEVPVEVIDLTFNKPFMYIIRDKDTNEVWFMGTVYEPIKYVSYFDLEDYE